MKWRLMTIFSLVLVMGLAAGCGARGPVKLEVQAGSFFFSPAELKVKANEPVTLTLVNNDTVLHDFSVDEIEVAQKAESGAEHDAHGGGSMEMMEPDLHVAAAPGQQATLEFTPASPGTYIYYCTEPGHREGGMQGTLIVE